MVEDIAHLNVTNDRDNSRINRMESSPRGRFTRFDEELGSGAYKSVWKAIDNETGCEVAWNIVKTSSLSSQDKERVRQEIELIKKLRHPNIIHFISAWHNREKEEVVFITEIMTGALKTYMKKIGTPRLRVIKQWSVEILKGLEYLHSQDPYPVIHRDLKCDNIFVASSTGEIRIGDLGLSTFMTTSCKNSIVGTPYYMAPELYEERYGPSVDIYAFGLCVLEMVTQMVPYSECKNPVEVFRKVTAEQKPRALSAIEDNELKEFIEICIKNVNERPTATELRNHPFLKINEEDENNHLPPRVNRSLLAGEEKKTLSVEIKKATPHIQKLNTEHQLINIDNDSGSPNDEIDMCVTIGLKNSKTGVLEGKKLEFTYSLSEDTPESVATELTQSLGLNSNYIYVVKEIIEKKLRYLENDKETGDHDGYLHLLCSCKDTVLRNEELSSEQIKVLQEFLGVNLGIFFVSGVLDARTEAYIKDFQELNGLLSTGVPDLDTLTTIINEYQLTLSDFHNQRTLY